MDGALSASLCRLVLGLRFEDLPTSAIEAAQDVLVDAIGTMVAAATTQDVRPFLDLAGASGPGPCRILGTLMSTSPAMAALANGALAHALDFEDTHDATAGHPNASLVPALIALAQAEGNISGREFVTALVAGCEVSCRMARAVRRPLEEGHWYPPPILASVGATMGAARLLRLDEQATLAALSLLLCQLSMPGQIKHEPGSTIRSIREAFPAQAAVQSVLLAKAGVKGFRAPIEGEGGFFALFAGGAFDRAELLRPLAGPFAMEELTFKPWPSCRGTHAAIELALGCREEVLDNLPQISRIVVEHDAVQAMLVHPLEQKRAPDNVIGAKFSIPFCTALALQYGRVDLESFEAGLVDPDVLRLAAVVEGREVAAVCRKRAVGGALELLLGDTVGYRAEIDEPKGAPGNPMTRGEIDQKFAACMRLRSKMGTLDIGLLAKYLRNCADCGDVGAIFAYPNSATM